MANKGLKEYTKQISQTIGEVAKVSINVNKEDANMHILIPLFQTLGPNPMDLSLIWNYQEINTKRAFGKGCNISTFKDIRAYSTIIDITDADGSTTEYTIDKDGSFLSKESALKVTKDEIYISGDGEYETYRIEDQQGNYLYFDETYSWYPSSIYKNGLFTSFDGPNMDNGYGAKITFTETSNYMYSRATYTQDGITLYYVDFTYDSNQRITAVKHYKESKLVKHLSISYGTNEITVKDEISKDYAKYTFSGNCVTKIVEVLNNNLENAVETSISYEDRKTTLTDNDGRKVYIYFDNNNFPLFEIDEDGNAIETEYDETTKRLTSQSSTIPTKNRLKTLATPNISMFTKTSGITTSYIKISDPVLSNILDPVFHISGTGSLSYTFSTEGLGGDSITAVIWGRQISAYTNSSNVKVKLTADGVDMDEFKKTVVDNQFDMMTLGISALKSYSKITLTITLTGSPRIEIGGIQILKKDFGTDYQYDENGNITDSETGKGSSSSVYNKKGLQISSVGKDSTLYNYEYDTRGNMTSAEMGYGGMVKNTYDSYNNVTKNVVTNASETKKLVTTKTYEKGRFVTSETDELGNETKYTYDSFGKIKKITDALEATTEYSYDAFDNLTKILFNSSVSVDYTYDSQNKLKTATLPNETIYSFDYDTSNNLNRVSMNGERLVSFTYDQKTGLIKSQTYGNAGGTYNFSYNTKHNVTEIRYNGILKYTYQYDQNDRLIKVLDSCGTDLSSYTYNNDGQVIKATNTGCDIEYDYDSLGEMKHRKRTLNSKTVYESFDSVSRSKGFSPDNLIGYLQGNSDYLGTMFNNDSFIKNPSYYCIPYNYKTGTESKLIYTRKGRIPCAFCGLTNPISYNPPATPYIENSGSIAFWFYPTSTPSAKRYLFYVKASSSSIKSYVAVYQNSSNQLVLELKDYNENIITVTTSSKVQLNQWNFFGLNFLYRDDGQGYAKVFSYELYLNTELKKGNYNNRTIMTDGGLYHIGYRFDGSSGYDALECNITALMIGCRRQLTCKQMQEYYSFTKDYIIGSSYLDGNAVDFSATSTHNLSETMLNQFEIYPLHNSLKSLKGIEPIAFDVRRISKTDKDRTFNYNNKIKRFAYVADEGRLEYDLDTADAGTVLMRAFIREDSEKQYFFECKDVDGQSIGLYRGSDKYLYIEIDGVSTKTSLFFTTSIWHTVGLSFKDRMGSGSLGEGTYVSVRAYLDGDTYSVERKIAYTYDLFRLSVGKLFDPIKIKEDTGEYNTYYPMLGQIEMLATRETYCEVSTLNTLSNELKDTTKVCEYDELGMLNKKSIHNTDETILSINMKYKNRFIHQKGKLAEELKANISHDDQLIEIPAGKTFTFPAYEVYAAYSQDVSQGICPEIYLENVSWEVDEQTYDEFGREQTQYDHIDQAFTYSEDSTFYNNTGYSIYILYLNENLKQVDDITHISHFIHQEIFETKNRPLCTRTYESDNLGNVTSISDTTFGSHSYTYNERGFLTKEDSTDYEYDSNGNITKAGTTTFDYDTTIKDRLKSVNGKEIKYGTNPLNPESWNGNSYTFEGRRLVNLNSNEYTYNEQGLRINKKVDNKITNYYYDGDKLITEVAPSYRLDFLYDENNQLYGFIKDNTDKYYYVRDFMQNILGIIDSNGSLVVKYGYTAYGKITSISGSLASTIGAYNPFRFKGYYYDTETSMYYCKSRYFVPEWCRWLNGDHIAYLNLGDIDGLNLFTYCENNPVIYVDENGNSFILAILIGAAIGAIAGVASQAVSDVCSNVAQHKLDFSSWEMSSWQTYAGAAMGGAIGGAFTPFLGPVSTAFITGFSQTFITMGLSNLTSDSKYSFGEMLCSSLLIGGVAGLTAGVLDNIKIPKINSGRGSLSAIVKQINTKLIKEQIKNVSIKTLGKMVALNLIYSAPFAVLNGFFTNGIVLTPKEL